MLSGMLATWKGRASVLLYAAVLLSASAPSLDRSYTAVALAACALVFAGASATCSARRTPSIFLSCTCRQHPHTLSMHTGCIKFVGAEDVASMVRSKGPTAAVHIRIGVQVY